MRIIKTGLILVMLCVVVSFSEFRKARADYVHQAQGYQIVMSEAAWMSIPTDYCVFKSSQELLDFAEKAINSIVEATGEEDWLARYKQKKVRIAVTKGASHIEGGYNSNKVLSPVVYLKIGLFAYNIAPVVHELTHIVCQGYSSISLREGLACYLNDELGGFPTVFNMGQNAHLICRDLIPKESFSLVSPLMGKCDILQQHDMATGEQRETFYLCAQSFVTYLIDTYGMEQFMKVYNAPDESAFSMYCGKELPKIQQEWIEYLENYEGRYTAEEYNIDLTNLVVENGMNRESAEQMLKGMGFYR